VKGASLPSEPLYLIFRQLRCPLGSGERELGLDKDLLHGVLLGVKLVVGLVNVLETHSVRDHLIRIELALADLDEELLPVLVHRCLAVSDESNATLHERPDVEVVRLDCES